MVKKNKVRHFLQLQLLSHLLVFQNVLIQIFSFIALWLFVSRRKQIMIFLSIKIVLFGFRPYR